MKHRDVGGGGLDGVDKEKRKVCEILFNANFVMHQSDISSL